MLSYIVLFCTIFQLRKKKREKEDKEKRVEAHPPERRPLMTMMFFTWSLQLGQSDRHVNFGKRFQIKRVRRIQRYNVAQIPTASKSISNLATGSFTYLLVVAHCRLRKLP